MQPPGDDRWLTNLVCPISAVRVRQDVVRLTALLVALLAIAYLMTSAWWIPVLLVVDFAARGSGARSVSLLGRSAQRISGVLQRPAVMIDPAPKQFAARVGLLLSIGMAFAMWLAPSVAIGLAAVLVIFALLEAIGNICVGCLVYSYVVVPMVHRQGAS